MLLLHGVSGAATRSDGLREKRRAVARGVGLK
jgi:hypothetical protein